MSVRAARGSVLLAGLPDSTGGVTLNRLCGSGLEAVAGGWALVRQLTAAAEAGQGVTA